MADTSSVSIVYVQYHQFNASTQEWEFTGFAENVNGVFSVPGSACSRAIKIIGDYTPSDGTWVIKMRRRINDVPALDPDGIANGEWYKDVPGGSIYSANNNYDLETVSCTRNGQAVSNTAATLTFSS